LLCGLCALPAFSEEKKNELRVEIQTPHPGFELIIQRVDRNEAGLHVLARIVAPPADLMYPMVIGEANDRAVIQGDAAAPKIYLLGRIWEWGDETAVADEAAYLKAIGKADSVPFTRAPPPRPAKP
jgi:hypothetical protein